MKIAPQRRHFLLIIHMLWLRLRFSNSHFDRLVHRLRLAPVRSRLQFTRRRWSSLNIRLRVWFMEQNDCDGVETHRGLHHLRFKSVFFGLAKELRHTLIYEVNMRVKM